MNDKYLLYKIENGETAKSIAEKFGLPKTALLQANKTLKIESGVTIVIPLEKPIIHIAEQGETIQDICDIYGVTQEKYIQNNGGLIIYEGMKIMV